MTLVAFATHPDRAEIITDTAGYTRSSRHLTFGHRKATPIPGHAAAITSVGSTFFAETFRQVVNRLAADIDTFDDLADVATGLASDLWRHVDDTVTAERAAGIGDTEVYLIGFSEAAERFRTVCLPSISGFEPFDVGHVHVRPTPTHLRPSMLEVHRLADVIETQALPQLADAGLERLARMLDLPEPVAPTTRDEWVRLAEAIRTTRAVEPPLPTGFTVYVAGNVELTTITRDGVDVEVIHQFDDTGDEWREMLAFSLHPDSQLAACACGSGDTYVECCLQIDASDACPCGSGETFADCCRVTGPEDLERGEWIDHQLPNILELCAQSAAGFLAGRSIAAVR